MTSTANSERVVKYAAWEKNNNTTHEKVESDQPCQQYGLPSQKYLNSICFISLEASLNFWFQTD